MISSADHHFPLMGLSTVWMGVPPVVSTQKEPVPCFLEGKGHSSQVREQTWLVRSDPCAATAPVELRRPPPGHSVLSYPS